MGGSTLGYALILEAIKNIEEVEEEKYRSRLGGGVRYEFNEKPLKYFQLKI